MGSPSGFVGGWFTQINVAFFAPKKWHQLTGAIRNPSNLTEISGVMTLTETNSETISGETKSGHLTGHPPTK